MVKGLTEVWGFWGGVLQNQVNEMARILGVGRRSLYQTCKQKA